MQETATTKAYEFAAHFGPFMPFKSFFSFFESILINDDKRHEAKTVVRFKVVHF